MLEFLLAILVFMLIIWLAFKMLFAIPWWTWVIILIVCLIGLYSLDHSSP